MDDLLLKVIITPALVTVASLAGRRFGPGVAGWMIAMPLTAGPVLAFIAIEQGAAFTAMAAASSISGLMAVAACGVAWVRGAQRWKRPQSGLVAGSLAFAGMTAVLALPPLPGDPLVAVALFGASVVAFRAARHLVPRPGAAFDPARIPPTWDLPVRAAVATVLVLAITAAAPHVGPRLAGILVTYPVYATTLAYFAERHDRAGGASAVFRGLFAGLYTPAVFFLMLALLLEPAGIPVAFAAAVAAAAVAHGSTLRFALR